MTVAAQIPDAMSGTSGPHLLSMDDLVAHGDAVTRAVAAELSALGGGSVELELGPAEAQEDASDLLPEQGLHGVMISMSGGPVAQVVVILDDELRAAVTDGDDVSDAAVPDPWLAAASSAVQQWAQSVGAVIGGALPLQRAAELDHMLPSDADLVLVAAGMFAGGRHAGTVGFLGRPAAPESSAGGATAGAGITEPTDEPLAVEAPGAAALRALAEVEMTVTAELGRTRMNVSALLELGPGSVIELERTAGSPIDLLVNGTLIARGEVVVIDEEYGIRLTEIVGSGEV